MFHAFFFVPVIVFMVIVAPIWLVLHYVTRWRSSRTLSREDERMLVDLWESAKRMEHRIVTLEKILDAEAPQWRRPTP
ncbi:envelope stress response membrane protein PspB [Mycobacterium sp. KBS0706]|uniref:envelope stress response membrane protein PspB n=1 Tax=Bacteria TaxID=2 RepID=UPI00110FF6D6|nr:envelope stress response membrane protein PspB [Mycobacterium sp. KBS0706]TSD83790.1 envelope stress response membrane protein PspB [Mycobacterium sp. KBS0706]